MDSITTNKILVALKEIQKYHASYKISGNLLKKVIKKYVYSELFFFDDFYIISYFNKYFVFDINTKYNDAIPIELFIDTHSTAAIINNNLLSDTIFNNLKKCYMLTKNIKFDNEEIFCSYSPHYLINLTLHGTTLKIYLNGVNMETEININNMDTDLKSFLKEIFIDMPEENKKMHYLILESYANT